MTEETNETVALNIDELSNAEIDEILGELPTTEAEFIALAKRDRQRIAENRHSMLIRLPLVAGPDRKISDADFVSQVERLWAGVEASNGKRVVKPIVKKRRRKSSKLSI
jgi:hypothetical protein